ncbi:MAG: hypothetical protein QOE28_1433 [Solirubrobacteraceae bacterium]|nr:hypothetical protein [Solirubrobacteraceae bacterium]
MRRVAGGRRPTSAPGSRPAAGADVAHRGDRCSPSRTISTLPDDGQARGGDDDAEPLPASELELEEAFGEDGEEHQSAREHRLHDRQRREREGSDVQPQARIATTDPTANHLERNTPAAPASGCRTRIGGASTAPRYFRRKAAFVATAEASASSSPTIIGRPTRPWLVTGCGRRACRGRRSGRRTRSRRRVRVRGRSPRWGRGSRARRARR